MRQRETVHFEQPLMRRETRTLVFGLLVSALLFGACSSNSSGVDLLDPGQSHFGKTYADWAVTWWQWIYAQPGTNHPLLDSTGQFCQGGQDSASPVFFLVGDTSGTAERSQCTVPAGKALFFPILNASEDNAGVAPTEVVSADQLKVSGMDFLASIVQSELAVSVDGRSLAGLSRGKEGPTQFSYSLPGGDNLYSALGVPGVSDTIDPSFAVGYWVMLPTLPAGKHDLQFSGDSTGPPNFRVDITYHLTVE